VKWEGRFADIHNMDPSSIALPGLQQADAQLEAAAARITRTGANSADGATLDVVDLSAEIVALISAQNLFDFNLATLKTAAQMQKSLVDLTG
jgi:flagellar basal body rod protein FlgG